MLHFRVTPSLFPRIIPPVNDTQFWIVLAALVVLALIALIFLTRSAPGALPYFSREKLLTDGELAFYTVLRQTLPSHMAISLKVRLADVLDCSSAARQQGYFAKVSQKHLDFVLYDITTTQILAAIELDDKTHQRRDRQNRDQFLNEAMATAGVKLLRIPAAAKYDARSIQSLISN